VVATTAYTGRWKPTLLCGSHTGCLHAESVLAWLAACCHRALESSGDRRLRAHCGTDGQTLPNFIYRYFACLEDWVKQLRACFTVTMLCAVLKWQEVITRVVNTVLTLSSVVYASAGSACSIKDAVYAAVPMLLNKQVDMIVGGRCADGRLSTAGIFFSCLGQLWLITFQPWHNIIIIGYVVTW